MTHTFTQIFSNQRFGYGSALLWLLFLLILILTLLIFWTSRYWIYYETIRKAHANEYQRKRLELLNQTEGVRPDTRQKGQNRSLNTNYRVIRN